MQYVIVVVDLNAEEDFTPAVYGPYENWNRADDLASIFPSDDYSVDVVPMRSLSEQLDNPYGDFMIGDSPDE